MEIKRQRKKTAQLYSVSTVAFLAVLMVVACDSDTYSPSPMPEDIAIKTLGHSGANGRIGAGDFEKDTLIILTGIPEDGEWGYSLTIGGHNEQGVVTVKGSKAKFANFLRLEWWLELEGDEDDSVDVDIELFSEVFDYEKGTFEGKFKKDMYSIYNWRDLQAMQYDLEGEYTIKNDIEFPDPAEDGFPEQGFIPVGASKGQSNAFTGKLNGDGYTLKDFYINREFTNFVGLFGVLSYTAEVNNLKMELSDLGVTGYDYVGALAGYADKNTAIEDCKVEGNVYGNSYTGGLVGYISDNSTMSLCRMTGTVAGTSCTGGVLGFGTKGSNIKYCFSSGTIEGTDSVGGIIGATIGDVSNCQSDNVVVTGKNHVGGFLGWGNGSVDKCSVAAGSVKGDSAVGGLVGFLENSGSITESCNKSNVIGKALSGGLVGINHGEVQNSYCYGGSVTGTAVVGGFIGQSDNLVKNCYSSMGVTTGTIAGGFIGEKDGTVTGCYWNVDKSSFSSVGNGTTYGIEEKPESAFTGFDPSEGGVREIFLGWDFSEIWAVLSIKNTGHPYLLIERNLTIDF